MSRPRARKVAGKSRAREDAAERPARETRASSKRNEAVAFARRWLDVDADSVAVFALSRDEEGATQVLAWRGASQAELSWEEALPLIAEYCAKQAHVLRMSGDAGDRVQAVVDQLADSVADRLMKAGASFLHGMVSGNRR